MSEIKLAKVQNVWNLKINAIALQIRFPSFAYTVFISISWSIAIFFLVLVKPICCVLHTLHYIILYFIIFDVA